MNERRRTIEGSSCPRKGLRATNFLKELNRRYFPSGRGRPRKIGEENPKWFSQRKRLAAHKHSKQRTFIA